MAIFEITQSNPNDDKLYLYPNGDLSGCTAWTANGAIPNYACVDEDRKSPDYADTYVSMATDAYMTDQYELPNSSDLGTINYVRVSTNAKIQYSPPESAEYYVAISPNSTCTNIYLSPNQYITTGWGKKQWTWNENPSTSTSWTWDDINMLTIGMRAKSPPVDEFSPIAKKVVIRPNGDSHIDAGITKSGADTYYGCVNEAVADGTTTYLRNTSTNDQTCKFNMDDPIDVSGTITNVTVYAVLRFTGAQVDAVDYIGLSIGGNNYFQTVSVGESWVLRSRSWAKNPSTDVNWSWGDINNLLGCVKLNEKWIYSWTTHQCTQFYIIVTYMGGSSFPINVTQVYTEIGYTPNSSTCTLTAPMEISCNHTRNVNMINFWNGDREVYDINRSGKSMVLKGMEYAYDNQHTSTPCERIECVKEMAKNGAIITLASLGDLYNGDYRIGSFGWNCKSLKPACYEWILELESAEL